MIERLHYITQEMNGKTHPELAEEVLREGKIRWVQLRVKNKPMEEVRAIAIQTQAVCRKYNAKIIINDHIRLAIEIGADGVHLGKQDMSTAEARKLSGPGFIIGGTANTFEDVKMHTSAGVDYIGVGPFRFTTTKEKLSPVLGLEGYKNVVQQCLVAGITTPLIAIGGIVPDDVRDIVETGMHGVAIAGYINHAEKKQDVINEFLTKLDATQLKV